MKDAEMNDEEALINSFVVPSRRERAIEFLANPKKRRKWTARLAHYSDLDSRWIVRIPAERHPAALLEPLLRSKGAGIYCHVISEDSEIDGKRLLLEEVLRRIVGYGMGTLVSCIPGVLAYYEGEGPQDRYILERQVE